MDPGEAGQAREVMEDQPSIRDGSEGWFCPASPGSIIFIEKHAGRPAPPGRHPSHETAQVGSIPSFLSGILLLQRTGAVYSIK